jgi:hypothetical protein
MASTAVSLSTVVNGKHVATFSHQKLNSVYLITACCIMQRRSLHSHVRCALHLLAQKRDRCTYSIRIALSSGYCTVLHQRLDDLNAARASGPQTNSRSVREIPGVRSSFTVAGGMQDKMLYTLAVDGFSKLQNTESCASSGSASSVRAAVAN